MGRVPLRKLRLQPVPGGGRGAADGTHGTHGDEELRRFVPSGVVERIERDGAIEAGERRVSVLFADLCGYTAWADERCAREVFRGLSLYIAALTRAIDESGGQVAEFNGDGVMAVFGAPDPLVSTESAALDAGRRMAAAVERLPVEASQLGPSLGIGIGIATGVAFVGGIRAANRTFWSAVGSTTNRAARLQELSRELESTLVIDTHTRTGAGEAAADLECRRHVAIRGQSRPQDLYVLPRKETR